MADIYGIVYKNKIVYVGQTTVGYKNRFKTHLKSAKKGKTAIYCYMRKHGIENFDVVLLETCSPETLNEKEVEYIEKYQTYDSGLNENFGGGNQWGYKHKDQTKKILSEHMKERWEKDRDTIIRSLETRPARQQTEEERQRRSESFKEQNPMFRIECREKLSTTMKKKYEEGMINPRQSRWLLKNNNNEILVDNMKKFCKEMNWSYQSLHTSKNRGLPYKGWTVQKI